MGAALPGGARAPCLQSRDEKSPRGPSLRHTRGSLADEPPSPDLGRSLPMTLAPAAPGPLQEPSVAGSPGSAGSLAAGLGTRGAGAGRTWAGGAAERRSGLGAGLASVMNLDDTEPPRLLNSLRGLGGRSDSKGSRSASRASVCRRGPDSSPGAPRPRTAAAPRPGLSRAGVPADPRRAPRHGDRHARAGAPRALRWVVWGPRGLPSSFACRRPHLVSANNYPVGATQSCHSLRLD